LKSDYELIALFVSNQDKTAFAQLVEKYQSGIRQFLRRLTAGDHALADDLAQETFILMYRKISSFNGQSTLNTWLHKVAYNAFLGNKRKQDKYDYVEDDSLLELKADEADIITDVTLEKLMKKLSEDERLVLTLHFSAGMSHGEIAEVTTFPLGTIKSHINRGKNKLAKLIKADSDNSNSQQEAVA